MQQVEAAGECPESRGAYQEGAAYEAFARFNEGGEVN